MANWFCLCSMMCVVNVCRSELIDYAWVFIVPGPTLPMHKKNIVDFAVGTCNETVSDKQLPANSMPSLL